MLRKLIYCQLSTFGTLMYAGSNKENTKNLENIKFELKLQFYYNDSSGHRQKYGLKKQNEENEENEENNLDEISVTFDKGKCMTLLNNIKCKISDESNIKPSDLITAINGAIKVNSVDLARGFLEVIGTKEDEIKSMIEENNTRKLKMARFTFYDSTNPNNSVNQNFEEVLNLNEKETKIGLKIAFIYAYKDNSTHEHDKTHTHDEDHEPEEEPKGKQDDDQSKTHRGCCVCGKR